MLENAVNRPTAAAAEAPRAFDLRRIGAHPDFWYPLAWPMS